MVRPGREPERLQGALQQPLGFVGQGTTRLGLAQVQMRIQRTLAFPLDRASPEHALRDRRRRFAALPPREILRLHPGHLELEIDPIEKGPGHPPAVLLDLGGAAGTHAEGVAVVAAGAPLRCLVAVGGSGVVEPTSFQAVTPATP